MELCGSGNSELSVPFFAVNAIKRKRNTVNGRRGQVRYESYTVNREMMESDMMEHIFPFMDEQKADELIMDNASCQDGLRDFIRENGYETPGFASSRRNHAGGYPPNSSDCMLLDACVFSRFKVLYAHANPQTVAEAIFVSKKIVRKLSGISHNWLAGLDELYDEIISIEGEGSHLMSD